MGTTTITVTADDGRNGTVSDTFVISVTQQNPSLKFIVLSNNIWIEGPDRDLRYSSNAGGNVSAGEKVPDVYLNDSQPDFKDNINISISNPNLNIARVTRTSMNGLFNIEVIGTAVENDRVELNLNQFQDKNGVVLTGKLVKTYTSGSWISTIE